MPTATVVAVFGPRNRGYRKRSEKRMEGFRGPGVAAWHYFGDSCGLVFADVSAIRPDDVCEALSGFLGDEFGAKIG